TSRSASFRPAPPTGAPSSSTRACARSRPGPSGRGARDASRRSGGRRCSAWPPSRGTAATSRCTGSSRWSSRRCSTTSSAWCAAFEIDRLAVVGVQKNRLGAVKVEEGLGLVTYTTLFTPDGPLDAPPVEADLQVPTREAPLVSRIAADLGLAGGSPVEKVDII